MIKAIGIYDDLKNRLKPKQFQHISSIEENEDEYIVRFSKPRAPRRKRPLSTFKDKYCRVVTGEKDGRAEIFLYGFIGQDFWWGDDELREETITDLAFVRAIRELEKEFDRIDVRINSPGGSVLHGDPIITAIRGSSAEIHTYVDGIAASMAADIWIAGDVRHMSINSKLMIHSTSTIAFGTAEDMRQAAKELDAFDKAAIATFAQATSMKRTDVKSRFYDYKDHWLTADDAEELGLIEKIEDYDTEQVVTDADRLTLADLIRAFEDREEQPDGDERFITGSGDVDPPHGIVSTLAEADDEQRDTLTEITAEQIEAAVKHVYGENVTIASPIIKGSDLINLLDKEEKKQDTEEPEQKPDDIRIEEEARKRKLKLKEMQMQL